MTCEGNVRFKTIVAEKIIKPRAIKPRENVSWVTRRAVIKLTYFSGFTTAIYRSSAKLHRFIYCRGVRKEPPYKIHPGRIWLGPVAATSDVTDEQ